jgi:prepilin-type N-terminal cleavage/methylation domain-containing protein
MKSSAFPSHSNRGFTLIELLVVIAIIGILAAILLPALSAMKVKEQKIRARREIAQIAFAISKYEVDYNHLPISSMALNSVAATGDDFTYGTDIVFGSGSYRTNNSEIMAILLDLEKFPDGRPTINAGHVLNPQKTALLQATMTSDTNAPGIGLDGVYRDPWGTPYIITIDANNDEKARDAFYKLPAVSAGGLNGLISRVLPNGITTVFEANSSVMVWSFGPDKAVNSSIPANQGVNKDNILSGK